MVTALLISAVNFQIYGKWLLGSTISIYMFSMFCVMSVSAYYSVKKFHEKNLESFVISPMILVALVLSGWSYAWDILPHGIVHGPLYLVSGALFIALMDQRWTAIIGFILSLCSILSFLNVIGTFSDRLNVFIGFYYPDMLALGMYICFVTLGGASDDGLVNLYRRLSRHIRRHYAPHLVFAKDHIRDKGKMP